MVKKSSSQNGSASVVVMAILATAIVGALGFVFWQNFIQSDEVKNSVTATQEKSEASQKVCAGTTDDDVEVNGVFCSEGIGVEFKVPEIFKGKFQKAENYDITEGSMENIRGNPAGKSAMNYVAVVESGGETLHLSVAKEPLRSGNSSIGHANRTAYFNAQDRNLYFVEGAISEYDSSTDSYRITQDGYAGEPIPSFQADNTKVYRGEIGDAGILENGYLMVVNDYLVIIKIRHAINPMEEPALDSEKPFMNLHSNLKQLKVL